MVILRTTWQRQLVIKEIENFNRFFNADELFERVSKKDKNIGIATIYRVLKDLRNKHKLHSYICNRKTIYSKDNKSHCHFTCEKCGEISHINIGSLDFLGKKIGGNICHVQVDVSGVCENCC